jgi:hypothetical protein
MNFDDLKKVRELKEHKEAVDNYKPEHEVGTWWVRKEGNFTVSTRYKSNNNAQYHRKKAPLVNNAYAGEIKKEVPMPEGVEADVVSITQSRLAYELPSEVIWYGEKSLEEGSTYFILVESLDGWRVIPKGFASMGPANKIAKMLRENYPHVVVITNPRSKYSTATLKPLEEMPRGEGKKPKIPSITLAQLIERFGDRDIRELGIKINYNILEDDSLVEDEPFV